MLDRRLAYYLHPIIRVGGLFSGLRLAQGEDCAWLVHTYQLSRFYKWNAARLCSKSPVPRTSSSILEASRLISRCAVGWLRRFKKWTNDLKLKDTSIESSFASGRKYLADSLARLRPRV